MLQLLQESLLDSHTTDAGLIDTSRKGGLSIAKQVRIVEYTTRIIFIATVVGVSVILVHRWWVVDFHFGTVSFSAYVVIILTDVVYLY